MCASGDADGGAGAPDGLEVNGGVVGVRGVEEGDVFDVHAGAFGVGGRGVVGIGWVFGFEGLRSGVEF